MISDPSIWTVAECIRRGAHPWIRRGKDDDADSAKIGKIYSEASSSLISKWKAAIGSANFTVAEFKTFINLMHQLPEEDAERRAAGKVNTLLNAIGNTLVTIIAASKACWNWYKNG